MSEKGSFHQLPAELLYTSFEYLWAHEIYFALIDVSDYVNSSLQSYIKYQLDLKAIRKDQFDLICRHIRPEQVISLTLSDEMDTYVQSEFFFSRFPIEQFTELRSLTLIKIDSELSKYILFNLYQLKTLRVFSFNNISIKYRYELPIESVHGYRMNDYTEILNFDSATILTAISFPDLRLLKLKQCSNDGFNRIFQHVSQLKSLYVCLNLYQSETEINLLNLPTALTRLSLEINYRHISMSAIRQILSTMLHLKHLVLILDAENDVADGYQWQILAKSLTTFNFKFNMLHINSRDILNSFRGPFWLEEKRWFVAYYNRSLFSNPHFAPVHIEWSTLSNIHSTTPNHSLIFSHVNEVTLNTKNITTNHWFPHVKTLNHLLSISFGTIKPVIDCNQVEHLVITSLNNLLTFIPLKLKLPQLYQLTVTNGITNDMIAEIQCYRFEQILKLELGILNEYNNQMLNALVRLFPCIQYLEYTSSIRSKETMIYLIDGFKNLSNASFCVSESFIKRQSNFCQNPNTIIEHSKRLIKNNFICRIYRTIYSNINHVVWWIGEDLSTVFGS